MKINANIWGKLDKISPNKSRVKVKSGLGLSNRSIDIGPIPIPIGQAKARFCLGIFSEFGRGYWFRHG